MAKVSVLVSRPEVQGLGLQDIMLGAKACSTIIVICIAPLSDCSVTNWFAASDVISRPWSQTRVHSSSFCPGLAVSGLGLET